jgi:hypothetical protein
MELRKLIRSWASSMSLSTWAVMGLSLMLLVTAVGCQAVAAAAIVFQPPPKSEAKYVPTTRPIVVFVDSDRQSGNAGTVRETITALIVDELREHKVGPIIDIDQLYNLRTKNAKAFRSMKVDEVGKKVGAEQVIFVDIVDAQIIVNSGGQLIKGKAQAFVRVVDVPTGQTLWPTNLNDGWPVMVESKYKSGNESSADSMREEMVRAMASSVAKLFYTYNLEE